MAEFAARFFLTRRAALGLRSKTPSEAPADINSS
jgi:hypothetical protein